MKQYLRILSLLLPAGLFFLAGCDEKLVIITPSGGNSGPTDPGSRKVLVEELTGVRCPNCPEGTATLVSLGNTLGEDLIVVSIHAAPGYDVPYPESKYDFRTAGGTEMANFIGAASFFPTASINRRIVPPETEPYIPRTQWAGIIGEELAEAATVAIELNPAYNAANRQLDVAVNLVPQTTLSGEHRLTVLITQDSIVDYQKVNLDKVPNYVHRHVLRTILTQPTGDIITDPLSQGAQIAKTFSFTLPAAWDEKHCSVVAFVHHGTDPDKEVLQAAEEHVVK